LLVVVLVVTMVRAQVVVAEY
jgi:hypothetical protein